MKLTKFTKKVVKERIKKWKDNVANSEFEKVLAAQLKDNLSSLYQVKHSQSYILQTINDKGMRKAFEETEVVILVGCGVYPYSLMDLYRRFPDKRYVGIEISHKRARLAKHVIDNTPAKGMIEVVNCDGKDYDYSYLKDEDMVFISCDVYQTDIFNNILKNSRAQVYTCAPYKSAYINGMFTS